MHVSQMKVRNALVAAVMSALVVGATGHAQAGDRFVSTTGSDAANDDFLFHQGSTKGLGQIQFHDYQRAYAGCDLPNVTVFESDRLVDLMRVYERAVSTLEILYEITFAVAVDPRLRLVHDSVAVAKRLNAFVDDLR